MPLMMVCPVSPSTLTCAQKAGSWLCVNSQGPLREGPGSMHQFLAPRPNNMRHGMGILLSVLYRVCSKARTYAVTPSCRVGRHGQRAQ